MKDEVQGTAIAAINFSIGKIGDHYDRLEFLKAWRDGLTDSEWPEFREYCTPTPIAASSEAGTGRDAYVGVLASLAAAISLLERTPRAKKAAASNKMFDQMVADYKKALETGRAALSAPVGEPLLPPAVAETDRTAPENAGLVSGVPSAPDHTTMEERGR